MAQYMTLEGLAPQSGAHSIELVINDNLSVNDNKVTFWILIGYEALLPWY